MGISRPVVIGRVGAPHGVRGWVRIQSWARPPESILELPRWLLRIGGDWRESDPADSRVQDKGIIVRFPDCRDRDAAATLRNVEIAVERASLPEPGADTWYWADLIGLEVVTEAGMVLGKVDHLLETGANDVLVVDGDRQRLIPWIQEEVIRKVDPEAGRILVAWDPDF